ncbi:ribonuclease Z [Myroides guanonis]|uniref:Uncharacterized protein n=1 Tax=Myroides guanonis TaxID=1150112 RepID=A0A1I3RAS6_9FLAO|nr:ribonuclease Z [Myroides guanonis]SFJ43285.1 hypothetical protein SAMN04487893_107117 [Myroides guanonis]
MKVKEKGHTLIIKKSEGTLLEFIEKINAQYNSYKKFNIIVDLSDEDIDDQGDDLLLFEELALSQAEENKSFVIVVENIDFNEFDEELVVVPTLLEAHDIIEMDEIQRDLGF